MTTNFLQGLRAAADATGVDQSKTASASEFEKIVYPEGKVRLRFVGYVELGKHEKEWPIGSGKKKAANKVRLTFEVSGPRHQPVVGNDGVPRPLLVHIEETLSLDPKANFVKLFSLLNHDRSATHAALKLGEAYTGRLFHHRFKRKGDKADEASWTGLDYRLRDPKTGAYSILPPIKEDDDTGEVTLIEVDPPRSAIMGFLWDKPTQEQWDSIFIEGEYPERKNEAGEVVAKAKSKNALQEKIMRAANFKGSPIHTLLMKAGVNLDLNTAPADAEEEAPWEPTAAAVAPATTAAAPSTAGKAASGTKPVGDIDDIPW